MNGFDFDGVITIGIYPGPDDVIITGRSYQEFKETKIFLRQRSISNRVFFNPCKFTEKTRESSGYFKSKLINSLKIDIFFEDDEIQKKIIEKECKNVTVVHIVHNLTEEENVRRDCNNNILYVQ